MNRTVFLIVFLITTKGWSYDLDGTWQGPCHQDPEGYRIDSAIFSGPTVVNRVAIFKDDSCGSQVAEVNATASWRNEDVPPFEPTTPITFAVVSVTLTPTGGVAALFMNRNKYCGLENWSAGESQDVAGLRCNETQMPSVNQKIYNIYSVGATTLTMGKFTPDFDGTSAEKRPRDLNTDLALMKK